MDFITELRGGSGRTTPQNICICETKKPFLIKIFRERSPSCPKSPSKGRENEVKIMPFRFEKKNREKIIKKNRWKKIVKKIAKNSAKKKIAKKIAKICYF